MQSSIFAGYIALAVIATFLVVMLHGVTAMLTGDGMLRSTLRMWNSKNFHVTAGVWWRLRLVSGSVAAVLLTEAIALLYAFFAREATRNEASFWCTLVLPATYSIVYGTVANLMYRRSLREAHGRDWSVLGGHESEHTVRELVVSNVRDRSLFVPLLFIFVAPELWVAPATILAAGGYEGLPPTVSGIGTLAGVVLVLATVQAFVRYAFPHRTLISDSFAVLGYLAMASPGQRNSGARSFVAARWRTPTHRAGYRLAACLERCVRGTERRLTPQEYDCVSEAYSKLRSRSAGTRSRRHVVWTLSGATKT